MANGAPSTHVRAGSGISSTGIAPGLGQQDVAATDYDALFGQANLGVAEPTFAWAGVEMPSALTVQTANGAMRLPTRVLLDGFGQADERAMGRFQSNLIAAGYLTANEVTVPGFPDFFTRRAIGRWLQEAHDLGLDPAQLIQSRVARVTDKGDDPFKEGFASPEEQAEAEKAQHAQKLTEVYRTVRGEEPPPGYVDANLALSPSEFRFQELNKESYSHSPAYFQRTQQLQQGAQAALSGQQVKEPTAPVGMQEVFRQVLRGLYGSEDLTLLGTTATPATAMDNVKLLAQRFQEISPTLLKKNERQADERTQLIVRLMRFVEKEFGEGGTLRERFRETGRSLPTHERRASTIGDIQDIVRSDSFTEGF